MYLYYPYVCCILWRGGDTVTPFQLCDMDMCHSPGRYGFMPLMFWNRCTYCIEITYFSHLLVRDRIWMLYLSNLDLVEIFGGQYRTGTVSLYLYQNSNKFWFGTRNSLEESAAHIVSHTCTHLPLTPFRGAISISIFNLFILFDNAYNNNNLIPLIIKTNNDVPTFGIFLKNVNLINNCLCIKISCSMVLLNTYKWEVTGGYLYNREKIIRRIH